MSSSLWADEFKQSATWIWHAEPVRHRHDMAFFAGTLQIPANAGSVDLHVSADSRYVLYADAGQGPALVGRGPARSDLNHWNLDPITVGLSSQKTLRLWAIVRWTNAPGIAPEGQISGNEPGFLCYAIFRDSAGKKISVCGTSGSPSAQCAWVACSSPGIQPLKEGPVPSWLGSAEAHRLSEYPSDWLSPAGPTQDRRWRPAVKTKQPYFRGDAPYSCDVHFLVPRAIPQMREIAGVFVASAPAANPEAPSPLTLPILLGPGESLDLLLDAGELVDAYPLLRLGGIGTEVKLSYAEVLKDSAGKKYFSLAAGATLAGFYDRWHVDIAGERSLEPFNWRAFRFVRLQVTAGPEGAQLADVAFRVTEYPMQSALAISSSVENETVQKIVDVSWRTIRRCMWETHMDCPYYEQMQYLGDTRLQLLCTMVSSRDCRLARQAISAFDFSRQADGITQSRYPCNDPQWIPTFSLIYVLMLEDYLDHTGEEEFIRGVSGGIGTILDYFKTLVSAETGLIENIPFWPFVDWVFGWNCGMPPGPNSSLLNMHYLMSLQSAARLSKTLKLPRAGEFVKLAEGLRQRIHRTYFDRDSGLLADLPLSESSIRSFSQHAQALATLTEVLSADEARAALTIATDESRLFRKFDHKRPESELQQQAAAEGKLWTVSIYFSFYLAEALAKVGMGDAIWRLLNIHRGALARGSTTWPESPEPARSECHAWSSWPMYFFSRYVLGVSPTAKGIAVRPLHVPPLDEVSGTVMTRLGEVKVQVKWRDGRPTIKAKAAEGKVRVIKPKT